MENTLKDYYSKIQALPLKTTYTKEELLTPDFLIAKDKNLEIYYCTHNEYINHKAKIFIIGITPGFFQMNRSIVIAREAIERGIPISDIPYLCKVGARFSGSIRKNIISMLNELNMCHALNIADANSLFEENSYLLHSTSLIPFSTFRNQKNYTGYQPPLKSTPFLMKYVEENLYPQLDLLKNTLVIPLGKCVEGILVDYIKAGLLDDSKCLLGFPHPSGANGHRKLQFEIHKEDFKNKIKNFNFET
ncbi:MAG: hypothetical protein MR639_03185 [Clostridium sp.]|uniref:uracil-DNA glycosylase family protein n=1 Tax=Clostridium sp. TaxID=1506 RepID=UPI002A88786F|nr:hypothetical protein [Clostridium sp.]MDY5099313.1 hypothetical protein [Clostridium sp.]